MWGSIQLRQVSLPILCGELDLAWMAGILEGEGYFGSIFNAVGGKRYKYPRIGVNMTDRDVVDKIADIWGCAVGVLPPTGRAKKVQYRAVIVGARAAFWMDKLFPWMGERRRSQIDCAMRAFCAKEPANKLRREWSMKAVVGRKRNQTGTFKPTPALISDFVRG